MTLKARSFVPLALAVAATMSLVAAEVASATHPRPATATKLVSALVPAFNECTAATPPNRQHGPPLLGASCNPPVQSSSTVTIGAASTGSIKIAVQAGSPGPPEDSDVKLIASATDIRCQSPGPVGACGSTNTNGGPDYIGGVEGNASIRITDHWNGVGAGGGSDAATVIDLPFPVLGTCAATASATLGATCSTNTSANAVIGGPDPVVKDGKRANVEIGQIQIFDSGPDGQVGTVTDNELLSVQGVFIP
jgi:hypothetical protein